MLEHGAGAAWSRLFLHGAGADPDPIWSEPESAPGPQTSGAAQKSGIIYSDFESKRAPSGFKVPKM